MAPLRPPIRVAGCSGSVTDRRTALATLARNCAADHVDCIIGDWMSEANMTTRGISKSSRPDAPAYEPTFLESLQPALSNIAKYNIKVVVNAGASGTEQLHAAVMKMCAEHNVSLRVAWISGDEVMPAIQSALASYSSTFTNSHTGQKLSEWKFKPTYAQAYLGGMGIATALANGADIVLCGRVSDASLTVGAAAWWHGWYKDRQGYEEHLANSLIAGHLIECSTYVTGGNFTGFKDLDPTTVHSLSYPIAEIADNGTVVLTKSLDPQGGALTTDTCTSQLLYEIQGPLYLNSDVVADISEVSFTQVGPHRVRLGGVRGLPPPPTTKVGLTAAGGFQAEAHWYLTGLDISAKAALLETQIRHLLAPHGERFTHLSFQLLGSAGVGIGDPRTQDSATATLRIVAQAAAQEDLAPSKFARPSLDNVMQTYPGATPDLDTRMMFPRPVQEYWVSVLPQSSIQHCAHCPWLPKQEGEKIVIPPPSETECRPYPHPQPSHPAEAPATSRSAQSAALPASTNPQIRARGGLTDAAGGWAELPAASGRLTLRETFTPWGRTMRGPLGWLVHARSGDKGSDANVGFWVRREDEMGWLTAFLTVPRLRGLLAADLERIEGQAGAKAKTVRIERHIFPGLRAVHFVLGNYLDRGVSCNAGVDILGKGLAEWLRSRWVDLPVKFLEKGKL